MVLSKTKLTNLSMLLFLVLALAMCQPTYAQAQQTNTVEIRNASFEPASLSVTMGTIVTWINKDTIDHTVTSDTGLFDSGTIRSGGRFIFTFDAPGTYTYHCNLHADMRGQVLVASSLAGTAQDSGQLPPQTGITGTSGLSPATGSGTTDYSQFYTTAPGAVQTPLTAPQSYDILGLEPTYIYPGGLDQQAVPYSQYASYSNLLGQNALWIRGSQAWTRYAQIPQGSSLSLLAITPNGGNGTVYELYPGGRTSESTYEFFQYNSISFYADRLGRHVLFITMGNQASNPVIIDVVGEGIIQNA